MYFYLGVAKGILAVVNHTRLSKSFNNALNSMGSLRISHIFWESLRRAQLMCGFACKSQMMRFVRHLLALML